MWHENQWVRWVLPIPLSPAPHHHLRPRRARLHLPGPPWACSAASGVSNGRAARSARHRCAGRGRRSVHCPLVQRRRGVHTDGAFVHAARAAALLSELLRSPRVRLLLCPRARAQRRRRPRRRAHACRGGDRRRARGLVAVARSLCAGRRTRARLPTAFFSEEERDRKAHATVFSFLLGKFYSAQKSGTLQESVGGWKHVGGWNFPMAFLSSEELRGKKWRDVRRASQFRS